MLDKKRFFHYSISQNNGWEKEEYAIQTHREKHPGLKGVSGILSAEGSVGAGKLK